MDSSSLFLKREPSSVACVDSVLEPVTVVVAIVVAFGPKLPR